MEPYGKSDCYDAGGVCGPWTSEGKCTKCHHKTRAAKKK